MSISRERQSLVSSNFQSASIMCDQGRSTGDRNYWQGQDKWGGSESIRHINHLPLPFTGVSLCLRLPGAWKMDSLSPQVQARAFQGQAIRIVITDTAKFSPKQAIREQQCIVGGMCRCFSLAITYHAFIDPRSLQPQVNILSHKNNPLTILAVRWQESRKHLLSISHAVRRNIISSAILDFL